MHTRLPRPPSPLPKKTRSPSQRPAASQLHSFRISNKFTPLLSLLPSKDASPQPLNALEEKAIRASLYSLWKVEHLAKPFAPQDIEQDPTKILAAINAIVQRDGQQCYAALHANIMNHLQQHPSQDLWSRLLQCDQYRHLSSSHYKTLVHTNVHSFLQTFSDQWGDLVSHILADANSCTLSCHAREVTAHHGVTCHTRLIQLQERIQSHPISHS